MQLFFILSLPRSRTTWLSLYLTRGDSLCFHDEFLRHPSLEHYRDFIAGLPYAQVGNADSSAVLVLDRLLETFPTATYIVVLREPEDVYASLLKALPQYRSSIDIGMLYKMYRRLRQLEGKYPTFRYDRMSSPVTLNAIEKHIYGAGRIFDFGRFDTYIAARVLPKLEEYNTHMVPEWLQRAAGEFENV